MRAVQQLEQERAPTAGAGARARRVSLSGVSEFTASVGERLAALALPSAPVVVAAVPVPPPPPAGNAPPPYGS